MWTNEKREKRTEHCAERGRRANMGMGGSYTRTQETQFFVINANRCKCVCVPLDRAFRAPKNNKERKCDWRCAVFRLLHKFRSTHKFIMQRSNIPPFDTRFSLVAFLWARRCRHPKPLHAALGYCCAHLIPKVRQSNHRTRRLRLFFRRSPFDFLFFSRFAENLWFSCVFPNTFLASTFRAHGHY